MGVKCGTITIVGIYSLLLRVSNTLLVDRLLQLSYTSASTSGLRVVDTSLLLLVMTSGSHIREYAESSLHVRMQRHPSFASWNVDGTAPNSCWCIINNSLLAFEVGWKNNETSLKLQISSFRKLVEKVQRTLHVHTILLYVCVAN